MRQDDGEGREGVMVVVTVREGAGWEAIEGVELRRIYDLKTD